MFKEFWDTLTAWKKFKLIFSLILLIFVIIISFQNWVNGDLKLVFLTVQIPLTLLIAISFFIGYTLAVLFTYKKVSQKEKEIKKLQVKIKDILADQKDSL